MSIQKPSAAAKAGAMLLAFTAMCGNTADGHAASNAVDFNKKFNLQIQKHPVSAPNDYSNPRTITIDCKDLGVTPKGHIYLKPEFLKPFDSPPLYQHFRPKGYRNLSPDMQRDVDIAESVALKKHLGSRIDKNHEICPTAENCSVTTALAICVGTPAAMERVPHRYNSQTNTYELAPK